MYGLCYLVISSISDFLMPLYIGLVIDALKNGEIDKVSAYCWQLALIVLGSGVFTGFRAHTYNNMAESIARFLRHDIFKEILDKDLTYFDQTKTGELSK